MEVKRKRNWNLGRSWAKAMKLRNTGVWLGALCSSGLGTAVETGVHMVLAVEFMHPTIGFLVWCPHLRTSEP